jgi:hypothetical protein
MLGVENVGDKFSVNISVTSGNIFATGGVWDGIGLHVARVSNHLFSTLDNILSVEGSLGAVGLIELVQNDGHGLGVGDVLTEVLDLKFIMSGLVAVEVDPSDQNFFGLELEDISELFVSFFESPDLVAILQVNGLDGEEFTGLSEDGKDRGGLEFHESRSVNTHHLNLTLKSIEG